MIMLSSLQQRFVKVDVCDICDTSFKSDIFAVIFRHDLKW